MKIAHVSDNHSAFIAIPKEAEVIIHSGDALPNIRRTNHDGIDAAFQRDWVEKNIENFKEWINGRPFILSSGNHDRIDFTEILTKYGIEAYNINSTRFEFRDLVFYGFPFIPYIAGEWSGECTPVMMAREIRRLKDELQKGIDVLVAHSPPYGLADFNFYMEHCGNTQMTNLFMYDLEEDKWPKAYLTGHCHEGMTLTTWRNMILSNAATTVHLIDL